jgi:hypothetical protein
MGKTGTGEVFGDNGAGSGQSKPMHGGGIGSSIGRISSENTNHT